MCNRIDRNTGGIVIAAKNAETLRVMNQKIRDREVEKSYLCIILGAITPPAGRLEGYLLKDEAKKLVSVHKTPVPGGRTAVTLYQTLAQKNGLSLVACRLVTGRTHQIRAQFAAAGHPLLGDGKYGRARENKKYGRTGGQALCSTSWPSASPPMPAVWPASSRVWTVDQVDFVTDYFPHVPLHP
ncbi:MAG: RluA family pseudouridine synthase [Evtepia gabavorous]